MCSTRMISVAAVITAVAAIIFWPVSIATAPVLAIIWVSYDLNGVWIFPINFLVAVSIAAGMYLIGCRLVRKYQIS